MQNLEGVWSVKESLQIKSLAKKIKRKLLIATISVSSYLDSSHNLKYAEKDEKDFAEIWYKNGKRTLGSSAQFDDVEVVQLFNHNATRESILDLRSHMQKLKPKDMVLFYVSGHGLLDDDGKFWFATHDVDFENPSTRGVSYVELEALLDDIIPQRKSMFIDACHSGLVDAKPQNDTLSLTMDTKSKVVSYANRGGKTRATKATSGMAYQQMQELFNNLSRGSGTVVISAAAGNAYAYESEKWNNGVFTYCLINGLKNRKADKNKDGEVTIDELSAYLSTAVYDLTDGNQRPNERQENQFNNFRL